MNIMCSISIGLVALTFAGCRPSLPHDAAVLVSNLGEEHNADLRYKILLKSGRSATIEIGDSKGWLKISLVKTDWDTGAVTAYYSKTSKFTFNQKPYAHSENQLDPGVLRFDELGVIIELQFGTPTASYLSILQGEGAVIRRVEGPDGKDEPLTQD